ncbi:MAG: hypothetical protein ACTSR4_05550, partial [Candidatus Hodarchaeales archaeon]
CSHCGSDLSMQDRIEGEIKPIVPVEIQGNFAEPPPPEYVDSLPVSTPSPSFSKKSSEMPKETEVQHRIAKPSSSTGSSKVEMSSNADYRPTSIEGSLEEITSQLTTLMKSQKVIETILTKINSELLKLRDK